MATNPDHSGSLDGAQNSDELLLDRLSRRTDPHSVAYPRLESVVGPQEGLLIPLNKGEQVIGRSRRHAHVGLDDTSVSRQHVKLSVEGDRVRVQDLGSRNGTLVNGRRLGPDEEAELRHLDLLKVGIYIFRLASRALTDADLAKTEEALRAFDAKPKKPLPKAPEKKEPLPPPPVSKPQADPEFSDSVTERPEAAKPQPEPEPVPDPMPEAGPADLVPVSGEAPPLAEEPINRRLRNVFIGICCLSVLAGLGFFIHELKKKKDAEGAAPAAQTPPSAASEPQPAPAPNPEPPPPPADQAPPAQAAPAAAVVPEPAPPSAPVVPVESGLRGFGAFLDLKSEPTTARVYFNDKFLGNTPVKAPVELKPGQEYTVTAEFELKDLHDRYQQKLTFKADARQEVIPLAFSADIGVVKVARLPRGVDFYLEGYYAYDKYRANPVRLDDISYGQPIYVPFGQYVVELRETVRVGSSQTYVKEIRYRRDFEISSVRREVELTINDRDLQFFPARIQSVPSNAALYLDGEKIGVTPFAGELPLGKHELKLTHEGFFDHVEPMDMRVNTPFESKIEMKTSKAGELIQQAVERQRAGDYAGAVNALVDALKHEVSPREKSKIHFLLGDSYTMMGNAELAVGQFEKAMAHPEFRHKAVFGLARAAHKRGSAQQALTYTVDVLLNVPDGDPLQKEAQALFKQLSPLKSVLYVSTEPSGASVTLNGREIGQKTPMILSELAFGNYRLEIYKQGFKQQQVRKNLKISEFVPVIIKLEPDKF